MRARSNANAIANTSQVEAAGYDPVCAGFLSGADNLHSLALPTVARANFNQQVARLCTEKLQIIATRSS